MSDAVEVVSRLYQAYITGLTLTVSNQRGAAVVDDWLFRLFRRQHEARFLPGFE